MVQPPQWPENPPARKRMGCWAIGAIIVGAIIASAIAFGTCIAIVAHQSPAEQRAAEMAASAAASVATKERAVLEAKTRKGCNRKTGPIFPIFTNEFEPVVCHVQIDKALTVPGSGDFPLDENPGGNGLVTDGCRLILRSQFTAKNAFGVVVRNSYTCTYDPTTGMYAASTN